MKYSANMIWTVVLSSLALLASSCDKDEPEQSNEWVLVWSDEFNTPTPDNQPDPIKWTYETGATGNGNNELQIYTKRPENIGLTRHMGEGCLRITALNDNYQGVTYSSARIKTEGQFEQQYGRFEARMKLPYGPGIWPAFWMLGNNYNTVGWPECGEIDIMENRGWQPNVVSSALHFPGHSGGNPITQTFGYDDRRFDTDFHIFAVEWDAAEIAFYVDGLMYKRVRPSDGADGKWVFNHPFFILLNLAVGGDFVGYPTDDSIFPQNLYVDYVRVYRRASDIQTGNLSSSNSISEWKGDGNKGTIDIDPVEE